MPGAASTLFEPAAPAHGHFLCKECGRVSDLDFILRPSTLRKLSEQHDLTIDDASIVFVALAPTARRADNHPPSLATHLAR